MSERYNLDIASEFQEFRDKRVPLANVPGVFPRKPYLRYGEPLAVSKGLVPVESVPDLLVDVDDFKEVIAECHAQKTFPVYHQYNSWCPKGTRYNQNGLNYCWSWSGTGDLMNCRAAEGKPTVILAPVSGGKFVGWRNVGNYLESFIDGARNDGICPDPNGERNSTNRSSSYWGQYDDKRKLFRLDLVWDTDRSNTTRFIQQCVSILRAARSGYAAWNRLSHAMSVVGMRWDESQWMNLVWLVRNSHNEDDVIEMTGQNAVPDEFYGFISTVLTE